MVSFSIFFHFQELWLKLLSASEQIILSKLTQSMFCHRWPDTAVPATAQPAAAPAPAGAMPTLGGQSQWHTAQDASGNTYEYNTATNETRWPQKQ